MTFFTRRIYDNITTFVDGISASNKIGVNVDRVDGVITLDVSGNITGKNLRVGNGSPENVVTADVGEIYQRRDGGPGTTLYIKESGNGNNTGWVGVFPTSGGASTLIGGIPGQAAIWSATDDISASSLLSETNNGIIIGSDPGGSNLLRVGGSAFIDSGAVGETLRINSDDSAGSYQVFTNSGSTYGYMGSAEALMLGTASDFAIRSQADFIIGTSVIVTAKFDSAGNIIFGIDPGGSDKFRVGGQSTFGSTIHTSTSVASAASINLPHGTAPTSPVDGDFWTTTDGLYGRINGTTVAYTSGGSEVDLTPYTLITDSAALSANLQDIKTSNVTTAAISAGLQTQINTKIESGNGSAGTWNNVVVNSDGIVTSGAYTDYISLINTKADYDKHLINSLTSGIISGGTVVINADPTTFDISAGAGIIVDNWTSVSNPTVYNISWSDTIGISATHLLTATRSHIAIDKTGSIIQLSTEENNSYRRDLITLAQLGHSDNTTIKNVNSEFSILESPISQLRDLIYEVSFITSGNIITPNGPNLQIDKSEGTIFGAGVNYNNDKKDPHKVLIPSVSGATFQYRTQTGVATTNLTSIVPDYYDAGGTLTAISSGPNSATNQRVYLFANGNIRIQYGQTVYNTLSFALQNIQLETFNVYGNIANNAILIAVISLTKSCTDLSDTSSCIITYTSKFGENHGGAAGLSTTNLQQSYNNSLEPEIITNSTLGALTLKRGSTLDSDNILEIVNGSDLNVVTINGLGEVTVGSISGAAGNIVTTDINGKLLNSGIDATSLASTSLVQTVSGDLQTQINNKIDSGNGSAGNWNNVIVNSDGIVTSGAYVNYGGQVDLSPYTLKTDSAALSANLQNIKTSNVTTAAISAGLNTRINTKIDSGNGSAGNWNNVIVNSDGIVTSGAYVNYGGQVDLSPYTLITDSAALSANLQDIKTSNVTTAAISAGLNSKFNLYTLKTDSAALSANLQNIKTSNVTTAAISANLQNIKTSNVTTAAISAGLQNIKTSNVTTAAISAGLNSKFNLYTLVTDSAALSANLQNIKTSNVTTAAISAGLQTQINTKIESGNGFAGNWNNVIVNSDGIVTSGAYINYGGQVDLSPYTLITDSAALSANLQDIKTSNVTTAAISAGLQTQLNTKASSNGSGISGKATIWSSTDSISASSLITETDTGIIIGDGTTNSNLKINNVVGANSGYGMQVGGVDRWLIRLTGSELGADQGSNLVFQAHDDSGTYLSQPLTFERATGISYFGSSIDVATNITLGSGYALYFGTNNIVLGGNGSETSLRGGTSSGILFQDNDGNTQVTIGADSKTTFSTPTSGAASINLPHGTAPTSPVNGDFWTTTDGLYGRINGTTVAYTSGGSEVDLTPYTLITDSAALSANLQDIKTSNVTTAAISAGLNSKFNLYTLVTDSAALSANLQDIKTSNVTTAAISAGLQTQINTKIDSGNGFAGTWNNVVVNSDGIVTSGAYVNYGGQVDLSPYTLITDSAALSANLQDIKTSNVTTAAISAGLNTKINNKIDSGNGFAGTWNNVVVNSDGIVTSGAYTDFNNTSILQGKRDCDTTNSNYQILHSSIDVNYSFPTISLLSPTSGSNIYVQAVTNRTATSFDVVLSEVPSVSGYSILWHLPSTNPALNGIPVINTAITTIPSYTTTASGNYNANLLDTLIYTDFDNTIIFPSAPSSNENHLIKNIYTGNIIVDGNGKNIEFNGMFTSTIQISAGDSLHFHFNLNKNIWYTI